MKFYLVVCVSFGQKDTSQCGAAGGRAKEAVCPCQDLTGSSQLETSEGRQLTGVSPDLPPSPLLLWPNSMRSWVPFSDQSC